MTQLTNWPATVRELGDMADVRNMSPSDLLTELERTLGPCPTRPADFVMSKHDESRYTGPDIVSRTHIITPVWNASTNSRSIDLWTMKEPGESDAHLTPQEAIQLATDLLQLANAALASDTAANKEGK